MSDSESGADFAAGIDIGSVDIDRPMRGHVAGKPAILVRKADGAYIVGAECTHYHAPLEDGLVVGDTIRCPWHHACFSLVSGRALHAPAFDALKRWRVEQVGDKLFARERLAPVSAPAPAAGAPARIVPARIVIVGGGAAGFAAAFRLREDGYAGALDIVSADAAAPYDRPNLSKEYLAGEAQPEWLPLRDASWYDDNHVSLRLGRRVTALDPKGRRLTLDDGETLSYDALLLATGAEPMRLPTPGADRPNVFYLRSLADSDRLIAAAEQARRAVVIGASFIGLEVAAALRTRGLDVHVVAPESIPMARILGPEIGGYVRKLHSEHGVVFHLEDIAVDIGERFVALRSGSRLEADIVVVGVGVKPAIGLAESAGLAVDGGVLVDEFMETSAPGVYAVGDIARWPDKISGERIRVEHWVVAERQAQTAARNMLGRRQAFDAAPFFWSRHYDQSIAYVGHASAFDRTEIDGDPAKGDCAVRYYRGDKLLAVATIGRDRESLRAEAAFERAIGAPPPESLE